MIQVQKRYSNVFEFYRMAEAGVTSADDRVELISLPEETVEVHTQPAHEAQRTIERARRGESLASETVPGLEFAIKAILWHDQGPSA